MVGILRATRTIRSAVLELENRLLTYLLAKKQNVKVHIGTQIVMIFIMKPQRQRSSLDLLVHEWSVLTSCSLWCYVVMAAGAQSVV